LKTLLILRPSATILVGTYKDIIWSQLPNALNELAWARKGWIQRTDGKRGVKCDLNMSNWNLEVVNDGRIVLHKLKKRKSNLDF
jgi:hypothetical protein